MHKIRPKVKFQHDIEVLVPNRHFVTTKSFSYNKFRQLSPSTNIYPNVLLTDLQHTNDFFEFMERIDSVVEFIHRNGGFTMIGWYKPVIINYSSLVSNNGNIRIRNRNYSKNIQVDNGEINFHMIEIFPTDGAMLDPT